MLQWRPEDRKTAKQRFDDPWPKTHYDNAIVMHIPMPSCSSPFDIFILDKHESGCEQRRLSKKEAFSEVPLHLWRSGRELCSPHLTRECANLDPSNMGRT
jgi:hypothetical protein